MKYFQLFLFLLIITPLFSQTDTLWYSSFGDSTDWVIEAVPDCPEVHWQIGNIFAQGDFPTQTVLSDTQEDGWAIVDSDASNGICGPNENTSLTTVNSVNCSDYAAVLVEFQTYYRSFVSDSGFLIVSTNNTDWPDLEYDTDVSQMPNVFQIFSPEETALSNPSVFSIDVSTVAGGENEVWFRFVYTGEYGYTWTIDDFYVFEAVEFDLEINDSFITHLPEDSIQYARIPKSQLSTDYPMNFSVYCQNNGYGIHQNLELITNVYNDDDVLVMNNSEYLDSVGSHDSFDFQYTMDLSSLSAGNYLFEMILHSDQEQGSDVFDWDNNVRTRQISITDDMFSIDGIGVYGSSKFGSSVYVGYVFDAYQVSNEWLNFYQIKDQETVYGVQVVFDSEMVGDTISLIAADPDSLTAYDSQLQIEEDYYVITLQDSLNGHINLGFSDPINLEHSAYYFGVQSFSMRLRIANDYTYTHHRKASVSNGNMVCINDDTFSVLFPSHSVFALRLLLSDNYDFVYGSIVPTQISEIQRPLFELYQNYPNPCSEATEISFSIPTTSKVNLKITNQQGKILYDYSKILTQGYHDQKIDLRNFPSGIYTYSLTVNGKMKSKTFVVL